MQVILNGQPTELAESATLATLLEQLQLGERRVAVERNGEIVPRSQAAATRIRPGDRIEIVHAIGGG
ncbi:MAG: sulfur carrier protein ThiS [Gammaproteobacteria bacterium]|nr:sulfur carrier protein ThiS [Gammaproteobacteria bacterium]